MDNNKLDKNKNELIRKWLNEKFSVTQSLDRYYMKRSDFPEEVIKYVEENWPLSTNPLHKGYNVYDRPPQNG